MRGEKGKKTTPQLKDQNQFLSVGLQARGQLWGRSQGDDCSKWGAGWRAHFLSSKYTRVQMVSCPLRHGGRAPFTLQMSQELLNPKEALERKARLSQRLQEQRAQALPRCWAGSTLLPSPPSPHACPASSFPARTQPALRVDSERPAMLLSMNVIRGNTGEPRSEQTHSAPAVPWPPPAPQASPRRPRGRKGPLRPAAGDSGPSSSNMAEGKTR